MPDEPQEFATSMGRTLRPLQIVLGVIAFIILLSLVPQGSYEGTAKNASAVAMSVGEVERHIAEMESAQERLYSTGDVRNRDMFNAAVAELQPSLSDLYQNAAAVPQVKNQLAQVKSDIASWLGQVNPAVTNWTPTTTPPSPTSGQTDANGARPSTEPDDILLSLSQIASTAGSAADSASDKLNVAWALTIICLGLIALAWFLMVSSRTSLVALYKHAVSTRDSQIESLRRNRSLLVTTLHGIGDALVATDAAGRITFMNPIAEKMTGWIESDAVGKDIGRVVVTENDKTGAKVELPVAQVLRSSVEKELASNLMVSTRDGVKKPIAGHAAPIWEEGGAVTGTAVLFRDITDRKGAREAVRTSEAHKEAIIENAIECVVMMDHEGRIIEFNAAAESTFGYSRSEALGRLVADLIVPPSLREQHTRGFKRFLQTRQPSILGKRVEMKGMRKGGAEIPIELAITEVPRQDPPVFATFLRDISDRKAAEAALVAAKEAAEAESRDKSQFLNNMSDELRTPLNAVIGYSEMLQDEIRERKPEEFVPDLKKINEAGRHLLMLVNDVLDLSRIEAGKMELYVETFEVADMVQDMDVAVQPLAARNNNRLKITAASNLGSMNSDRLKIRQCILYLVNNACKFANDRDLELQVARVGAKIRFRMSDLSPGIAEEADDKLAEAFASANPNSTLRFGGHGLGLVIARHLCEMMGGDLVGERKVGHSPSYTITLPDKINGPSK